MQAQSKNIVLEGSLKTADDQRGPKKPQRLTKTELRRISARKFTQLHIEDQERKRNQVI